jgi:hypothetical protein
LSHHEQLTDMSRMKKREDDWWSWGKKGTSEACIWT